MARSDPGPPEACKSNGSKPQLVFVSGNSSYNSLTQEEGWKARGYADPIEEERGSMPPHAEDQFDRDVSITFNSNNGIYSSSGSRPDVYSSWQGSDQFLNQGRDGDSSSLFDSFLLRDDDADEVESPVHLDGEEAEVGIEIPLRGMVFRSEMEAEKFYYNYAENIGFKVRKGKVQRLSNGNIKRRFFLCSCEGFRAKNLNQSNQTKNKYQRKETRTGCNAHVQVTLENGQWVITELQLEHNHHLDSHNQRSNKNILDRDKLRLGVFSRNIRSKHQFELVESQAASSKMSKEEGPSKVHTPSILEAEKDVVHTMAAESFEGLRTGQAGAWKLMSTTQGLEKGNKLPPLHPRKVSMPPQPQEEKEDTMSTNLQDWAFSYGNKEVVEVLNGTEEVLQHNNTNDFGNISNEEVVVKERAFEMPILSSFATIGSDLSPPTILSPEIQGSIAPTTVQVPTLPIPTMTNFKTLVTSNLQPPPQGIIRDEGPIPQTGADALAQSLAWIRETSIQVQRPWFSPEGESILEQIFTKYGDITADCCFTAPQFRAQFLASIVKIVQLMQQHTAQELSDADISFICSTLSDLERAQVKVDWLRTQFVAVEPLLHYARAEAKRARILVRLNAIEVERAQLEHERDQSEAVLQGLKDQMPHWLAMEDKLCKGLL